MNVSSPQRFAMATPSYHGDYERCHLLCESIDRFITGLSMHYIMVDEADLPLFRSLAGPHRCIITAKDLLPSWLKAYNDPFSRTPRRVWTGTGAMMRGVPPLRGWHIQQLLKMALPEIIQEDVILYADSDVTFLRAYDLASQIKNQQTRLYRKSKGITANMPHAKWAQASAKSLGIRPFELPADDYITSLITWRRDNAVAMLRHIEKQSGRHWITSITYRRNFSEWMLYGMFCDHVMKSAAGHFHEERSLAYMVWDKHDVPAGGLGDPRLLLEAGQVAIGVQSFIGFPVDDIRRYMDADLPVA